MVASLEDYQQVQGSSSAASDAITAQFFLSAFLQLFLSSALSMLWNVFNTLQILTALNLLMVIFPANVVIVNQEFASFLQFEIVPKDVIYEEVVAPLFDIATVNNKKAITATAIDETSGNGSST